MTTEPQSTAIPFLRRQITRYGVLVAHPLAFLVVLTYGALWLVFERRTFDFHAVATLGVWFMTLFIQRVWHRDTQAIHAKLDELLHVVNAARNDLTWIDQEEPEEIELHRNAARRND
jgi:low affinity Fe/Cu permease